MAPQTRYDGVHDMPIGKKVSYRVRRLTRREEGVLNRVIRRLGMEPRSLYRDPLWITCFDESCMIYSRIDNGLGGVRILYSDGWIGVYRKDVLAPSPQLYEEIYRVKGIRAAAIVKQEGVKAFLYGNDVLSISIIEEVPPLDVPVAIIDGSDGRVVGIGVRRIDGRGRVYYMNVFDLGVFIREWG